MMQKKSGFWLTGLLCAAMFSATAAAKVSEQEAARLGKDLTPFGSEKKGNADGTIPTWDGGFTKPPASYKKKGQHHPDPFKDDKIMYTVDSNNVGKYKDNLSVGVKTLIETYPTTFNVPVYKSRRTHAVPDWVAKNTRKNATSGELARNGAGIQGAYGGYPFPILDGDDTEKALQALWNHLTRWRGTYLTRRSAEVSVQRNGDFTPVISQQEVYWNFFNPDGNEEGLDNILFYYLSFTKSPPRLAGGAVLVHETMDQVEQARQAWGYNEGQRRVKKAPNIAYDSPIAAADNLRTADDTDMYNGAPDKYNWKYVGMKEVIIPYNNYAISQPKVAYKDQLGVSNIKPEFTRWELHRVHVIEASLKKGARHIYSKRRFYIDADSWGIALADQYDARGELWRVSMSLLKNYYELPGVWSAVDAFYDLQARRYHVQGLDSEEATTRIFEDENPNPKRYFNPAELRRRGVR